MALNTQVLTKSMTNGFAGSYARQPEMIVSTRKVGGASAIEFGAPLKYDGTAVVLMGASSAATDFVGFAGREFKTSLNYLDQKGEYAVGEDASVFQLGCINVKCQKGTPALNGDVYVRITANASYPTAVVGGLEAAADSTNTVKLTNVKWNGAADANGVAEVRILNMINA